MLFNRPSNQLRRPKQPHADAKSTASEKNYSTTHAINYSINKILSEIEPNNHVVGIFVDLSKVLDTIDHQKLLTKLG